MHISIAPPEATHEDTIDIFETGMHLQDMEVYSRISGLSLQPVIDWSNAGLEVGGWDYWLLI